MNRNYNYVTVDYPNVPLICRPEGQNTHFGQFQSNTPVDDDVLTGHIQTRDMFLPNFSLRAFQGTMPRDAVFFDHQGAGLDMLGSCIFFKGKVKTWAPGGRETVISRNRSHNFKFDPNNEFRHLCPADTDLNFVHISFLPEFLMQLLPENEPWADDLRNRILRRERIVGSDFASISLAQEQALANVFDTPLTGKLGYMMIETSVIQVILLQLYALFQGKPSGGDVPMNKKDLEIAHELKEHLATTFLDDHSISGLAQHFGTNTNKLMGVFKKTFGKCIFEFIAEQRMGHALRLLSEEGMLVTEVARTLGYKNPNHFSTAFKKKFGVNPSVYRG